VLTDLIESKTVPVARLTEVHRQAGSSWIVRAAHAVNRGEEPESAPINSGDFYFIEANEPEAIIGIIRQMVTERIPKKFGFEPFRDVQVLTPQVRTELGVSNLNRELQAALNPVNPDLPEVKRLDTTFRAGDKVMQIQNNYNREVYNGDIGRVLEVDIHDQTVGVEFEGRKVEYDFNDLDELQLAYACTIHKSQGSEYPAVVIPVHTQHYTMLQRNLLYTGITRGRKLVVLVGSRKALWRAVNNMETKQRYSLLMWRLRGER
jgi:exodeoxyribonuclease V alpha subunit